MQEWRFFGFQRNCKRFSNLWLTLVCITDLCFRVLTNVNKTRTDNEQPLTFQIEVDNSFLEGALY